MANLFIKGIEVPERSYLDSNFFTKTYINNNFYTKTFIDNTFPTKTYLGNNFLSKTNNTSYTPSGNYNPATKKYVDDCIAAIRQLHFEIVQELPSVGDPTIIYMVLQQPGLGQDDYYDEYIYINDTWEKIGSTRIDLSPYYTAEEVDEILEGYTSKYICTESEYAELSPEQKAAYDLFIINPDPIPEPPTLDLSVGTYDFSEQKITINNIDNGLKAYLNYTRNEQANEPFTVVWQDNTSITNVISADRNDSTKYYFHVKGICPQSNNIEEGGWRDNFFFAFYIEGNTLTFELQPSAYNGYDRDNWEVDNYMCTITLDCEENDEIQFLDRDVTDNHPLFTIYGDLSNTFVARAHVVPRYRWYRNGELLKECAKEIDQQWETWTTDDSSKDPIDCYITLYGLDPNEIESVEGVYSVAGGKTVPSTTGFTVISGNEIKIPARRRLCVRFIITDINGHTYTNDDWNSDYGIDEWNQIYFDWWV